VGQKEYYEATYSETVFPLHQAEPPDLRIVDGAIPEGKRILSIGCGEGGDVKFLVEKNEVYGVDLMSAAVEAAQRNGIKAITGNVEAGLPYGDREFDVVVCKDILEHVFYPEKVMGEVSRILKPDGYAIVNVPNHFYYKMRFRILLGKGIVWYDHPSNEWDYFHIRFFTFESFRRFLDVCGFKPVKFFLDIGMRCYSSSAYYDEQIHPKLLDKLFSQRTRSRFAALRPNLLSASFYAKAILK
jgi:methionine biosynthesis protein MetW